MPLRGAYVTLRATGSNDYDYLERLHSNAHNPLDWLNLPGAVNPATFNSVLWQGALCHFLVEHTTTRTPVGHVFSYRADLRNRFAYIAAILDPSVHGHGWPFEGVVLFVKYLFAAYGFEKLYAETSDHSLSRFSSGLGTKLHEEGRLKGHVSLFGTRQDLVILALYARDWQPPS